jgi:hypothetical protein
MLMFDPLQIPNVFRARSVRSDVPHAIHTGFAVLDRALGGGWIQPALIEILIETYGIGELQLLMPLLRHLISHPPQPPLVVWLNPPHEPNAVALAQHRLHAQHWLAVDLPERDALWSAEKSLRSNACSATLAWASNPSTTALRRLKLATMESNTIGVLFREPRASLQPSPATMRLLLRGSEAQLAIEILKCPGTQPSTLLIDVRKGDIASAAP